LYFSWSQSYFWKHLFLFRGFLLMKTTFSYFPGMFENPAPAKSIYKFGLSVCLSVCLFVSNKRPNGWTDRAQIFCGTSRDPREGLWMIEILNICLHQNSIVIKFLKILKIREIFCENPRIIFVLFHDVHKENMFTINLEDGREAPSKASIF